MRIAHLILAHNNPAQLARLVGRLKHPDADIYIHLDLKAAIEPYACLVSMQQVYFIKKRTKVYWGSYSIVQSTLNGFEQILSAGKEYQYINLLSGNDYPIKSIETIHRFFDDNPGRIFMEYVTENSEWWQSVKERVTNYHLTDFHFPGCYQVQIVLNKLLPKRRRPQGMLFAGRSQWLTITPASAQYVLDYLAKNKNVRRFFRFSWGADEIAIQSILYNSPFKEAIVNNNYRYIDWSQKKPSPKTFRMEDKDKLTASSCFFARKFDMAAHPDIMDYLDHAF